MNKKYIIPILFLSVGTIFLQSCSKDYFDLNENPNQVAEPTLGTLLTTATHKTGINSYNVSSITSTYVQYLANPSASASPDIYQIVDYTGTWDALYFSMADISDLKKLAVEKGSSEYVGAADVMLAYHLNLVTDLWGDAPFSDAFKKEVLTPAYDSQEDLYATAMGLLDEAITELEKTDATIKLAATSDLIHGGNREKWRKTANALKARMLIKLSKQSSYNPASVLAAVDSAFKSNADDAGMASFQLRNNWSQVARNNASLTLGGWLSEQLIDHLNGVTYGVFDPRIRKITDPTVNNVFIGTINGAGNRPPGNNTVKDECYVAVSSPWTSETAPLLIMTYAELKFIEAEAALATNPDRAYAAYLAGINANMDKLQVPAGAERTDYITAASVGAAALTKELIFKEKYIATYLNPEAWNDARRHDYAYKDFTLPQNAVLTTFIRRLEYPTGERSKNGKNVPSVGSLADKLWWDQ
ncbi:SusD/RagB family nutrient-binding outer membrane lipoprotein [Terrimonas pollutisoli]|uniref:SusD/RagB family nutrient-binding outer membrane lipoprotein n=1 Tax=Terrimonas pollutisoli TaxID=3034147 RepID=UPI0023EAD7D6|nr:SusD/RagB family nutrient-binding outer membrane lipoprotein [Terrimonas sp. H1YJ31]